MPGVRGRHCAGRGKAPARAWRELDIGAWCALSECATRLEAPSGICAEGRERRAALSFAAPGSRRVLPLSSPLRTGREGFPSSGSSPWPLSPVLLVTLPMAPGVYQTFVVEVVCSTLTCRDNMLRFYGFSRNKGRLAQSAPLSLPLVQASVVGSPRFPCPPVASFAPTHMLEAMGRKENAFLGPW